MPFRPESLALVIEDELGRGSHCVVYRATLDGRRYAVKRPLVTNASERLDQSLRFLREAVALARIRHPSLPAVFEVGEGDGTPYLVMELATGERLSERLSRGPLNPEQVLALAEQLGSALEAVHRTGLIHRDVKPSNIVYNEPTGHATLVDFGLVTMASGGPGVSGGTPAYAAPEVARGEHRETHPRVDLYALGATLFECAVGERLCDVLARRGDAPALLGATSLPGRVIGAIRELIVSEPADRCQSAGAFLHRIHVIPESPSRLGAPPAPLVGREADLHWLRQVWAGAQTSGRVAVVRGAPGVGKSRLVREVVTEVSQAGHIVLKAVCHPFAPGSLSVIRQLIDGIAHGPEPENRERRLAALRRASGDMASLLKGLSPDLAGVFRDAPSLPRAETPEHVFVEGLSRVLVELARELAPIVVVVEDVQWIDAPSRRVLQRAMDRVAVGSVMYLLTVREDGASDSLVPELIGSDRSAALELRLKPLTSEEVVDLTRSFLGAAELDADLVQTILGLTDGTPMGVLALLRTLLDEGALRPHWGRWHVDRSLASGMDLPRGTTELLVRRVGAVSSEVRKLLVCAAAVGNVFDDDLVATAVSVPIERVEQLFREAEQAHLIESAEDGQHAFMHQSIRDALLLALTDSERRTIHQSIAEELDRRMGCPDVQALETVQDSKTVFELASHYAGGILERTPQRALSACAAAARQAFERFDNERALAFFDLAENAASEGEVPITPDLRFLRAQSLLRTAALVESLQAFREVLISATDPLIRAKAFAQIAWIYELQLDSTGAWDALGKAFSALGERLPEESGASTARALGAWLQSGRTKQECLDDQERERLSLLCSLYYQVGRVALHSGNPLRIVLSGLAGLQPAERLGPSPAFVKTSLLYAFVLTAAGMVTRGRRYLDRAEATALSLGDSAGYSHALQVHSVIAAWGGDIDDALRAGGECLLDYGHWRELSEFCYAAYNQQQMEAVRGRALEGWQWLELAVTRVHRHEGEPVALEFLELGARATLTCLGREDEAPILLRRVRESTVKVPRDSGFYPSTFGPRIRFYTERMDLGVEFEQLVSEFQSMALNPRRVHLDISEYYVHVAHARVHDCLRSPEPQRAAKLDQLRGALDDLKSAARIPLLTAHYLAVKGFYEFLCGKSDVAGKSFDAAERLGTEQSAPWVLYSVYRGRAHLLRAEGKLAAAHDQAVLAETIAREHGAVYRARWVREEFDLRPRAAAGSLGTKSTMRTYATQDTVLGLGSRARRQLRALLRISRARAQELDADHQARLVVDELVEALRARRGVLFLQDKIAEAGSQPFVAGLQILAARDVERHDLPEPPGLDLSVIREAYRYGAPGLDDVSPVATPVSVGSTSRHATIAAPLVVGDAVAGVVYLDRPLADGAFTEGDGEILSVLASQVSVALELTRSLYLREQAEENRRATEKMEGIARFARGMAHDVNNMIGAIRYSAAAILETPEARDAVGEDAEMIRSATQRVAELTRQLTAFGQGELGRREPIRLVELVERLLPTLVGLTGDKVEIVSDLREVPIIEGDPNELDQVITNLVVNARDALPDGGRITIVTRATTLDDEYVRTRPRVDPGEYVELRIQDTGLGMSATTIERIFEPYFTTKTASGGTGLGLANVYAIVKNAGGHIDVASEVGEGTTFCVYFPAGARETSGLVPRGRGEVVAVCEHDPIERTRLEEMLLNLGYAVLPCESSEQALAVTRLRAGAVKVVLADALLPGMNSLELARELGKLDRPPRVLHFGSNGNGIVAERGIMDNEVDILPKPVPSDVLARRLRQLLAD